jgi:hypothetical protein
VRNDDAAFQEDGRNVGRGFTATKFGIGMRIGGIADCRSSFKTWGKMRGILCYARRNVG